MPGAHDTEPSGGEDLAGKWHSKVQAQWGKVLPQPECSNPRTVVITQVLNDLHFVLPLENKLKHA